jgi:gamma-D-glutamyl-L-lysine dipeptidyl-peptidase
MKIKSFRITLIKSSLTIAYFCVLTSKKMKKSLIKAGLLFGFLFYGSLIIAQNFSYTNLSKEIQLLQKHLVPDKRVAILAVEIKDTLQPKIIISGETNLPAAKTQIIQLLTDKNISFIDSIKLLPGSTLGNKTWALATLSVSNIRAMPDHTSELVSQVMMGTPLKVLEFNGKWYRVQTPEYYIGWMDTSGLRQFDSIEMNRWKTSDRFIYSQLSGYAYGSPSSKGNIVSDLVIGDLFEVVSKEKGFLCMRTPDGRFGYVNDAECLSFNRWCSIQPNVQEIISVARQMMGSPYLWGGVSSKGADCSGFVKLAYYSQGIILARDASQQALYGQPVNPENLQPGDLVFFGSSVQHIGHVGIYIGDENFIHCSGKVHISSLNPNNRTYNPLRKMVCARRILNSLDTAEIVPVKNHPWYNLN